VDGLEFSPADEGVRGMVLMRPDGRVLAIDESARSIFTRIAMFEGSALNPFVNDKIRPMLNYITRSLGEIFNVRGDVASDSLGGIVRVPTGKSAGPKDPPLQLPAQSHPSFLRKRVSPLCARSHRGDSSSSPWRFLRSGGQDPSHKPRRLDSPERSSPR